MAISFCGGSVEINRNNRFVYDAVKLSDLQDSELAALAAAGERAGFGELARRHASGVRTLIRRMGAQPTLADDVAQDAFIIAFERIATFRNEGPFRAWLYRIAARLYLKRWTAESRLELFAEAADDLLDALPDLTSDSIDLDQALKNLSSAERVCVSLCHGVGFSQTEIAAQLRWPLGTVKSHVKRGLNKLKLQLGGPTRATKGDHHE